MGSPEEMCTFGGMSVMLTDAAVKPREHAFEKVTSIL
jgi:hypothetical protein